MIKTKTSFFERINKQEAERREWVYQLRTPIPLWVWQKWHLIDDSDTRVHVDGRELFPGDTLILEDGEFMIVRRK